MLTNQTEVLALLSGLVIDRDRDEAKDDHCADNAEVMDIGDVDLKAEASILAKEVNAVLALMIWLVEMNHTLNVCLFWCALDAKGGGNDRRGKSSPEG